MHTATDVRFSTRSLLIVMGVVAVSATALGAFIRSFPEDVRLSLAAYWSFLVVIVIGVIIYHARKRYKAEQQAGRVQFVLPRHSYFLPRVPWVGTALVGSFFFVVGPAMWIVESFMLENRGLLQAMFSLNTYYGPAATGMGITIFWWRNVHLTEHGLVVRNMFFPWTNITRWYWDACNKNVAVISGKGSNGVAVLVPLEDRDAVDSLLHEKVQSRPTSMTKTQA